MEINKIIFVLLLALSFSACTGEDSGEARERALKNANRQTLGSSAADLLSDTQFTSMNIEIVYVEGYQPSERTIANFKDFLENRTYKPDGINISMRSESSSNKAPFEIEEIVDIEDDIRSTYNAGDEIAVFIYFADGTNENDEGNRLILGSAYRNTSMVIYGETVKNFANRAGSPSKTDIETAVMNHEFGHLFGLVDLGTEQQTDHKDEDNAGHCNVSGCLMVASIEFGGGLVDVVEGGSVPEMDDACILDLQANGGR